MQPVHTIWVTGADGQVGNELRQLAAIHPLLQFIFTTRKEVDLTSREAITRFVSLNRFDVCINAAAYTGVDLAEQERELSMLINGISPGWIAESCYAANARLIHISTDYVFDGTADTPYREDASVNPVNYYGQTKLAGEKAVQAWHPGAMIVRTSWVYSRFGKNFVKTMCRLMQDREVINVVDDQWGSPTYARDLAMALLMMATHADPPSGIYHYCNRGVISWFQFASAIAEIINSKCRVEPINTAGYPTPARRPSYSALDTEKISNTFSLKIPEWRMSLRECLNK